MASQSIATHGTPSVTSAASAFRDAGQQAFVQGLVRDLITTRNALDALTTAFNALVTLYNAHTHGADGSEAGAYFTSKPQTDTETVSQVAETASAGTAGVAPASVVVGV